MSYYRDGEITAEGRAERERWVFFLVKTGWPRDLAESSAAEAYPDVRLVYWMGLDEEEAP